MRLIIKGALSLFLLLAVSVPLNAQYIVQGVVTDSLTREPLSYVSVRLKNTTEGTTTGSDGRFYFKTHRSEGTLVISTVGYNEYSRLIHPARNLSYKVALSPATYALNEVLVKPKREHYKKKDNPAVEFVRRMIEHRDDHSPNEKDFWQRERYEKTTFALNNFDEEKQKKMVCVDPNDIPAIAIVDAELMYTLPKSLTAATGMDALTHAIEGLITKGAWEMSDMFEIKAIEMINRYLETAVKEPTNPEARNGMAVAQYIAGMAFSNVGLGVVHGMAHPLGAIFDIPHGVANALLLPTIMEFNAPAALDKYVQIAKAMDVYVPGMGREEAADAAVQAVKDLSVRVGIPQHLSELGIQEKDLDRLADAAFADVCTPGNPREVNKEIILNLYQKVL